MQNSSIWLLMFASVLTVLLSKSVLSRRPITEENSALLSVLPTESNDGHQDSQPKLALIGIFTTIGRIEQRSMIRTTYLRFKPKSIDFYFIVGQPATLEENIAIEFERDTYGDIIILTCEENKDKTKIWFFFDHVYDMRLRAASNSEDFDSKGIIPYSFVFKGDDDSFIHLPNLEKTILTLNKTSTYWGRFQSPDHKYWLERAPFAIGMLYGLSWDLVEHIKMVSKPTAGPEDHLVGRWVKDKALNVVNAKHLESADAPLRPDTIVVHPLKTKAPFLHVARHYFGGSIKSAQWKKGMELVPYSKYSKHPEFSGKQVDVVNVDGFSTGYFSVVQTKNTMDTYVLARGYLHKILTDSTASPTVDSHKRPSSSSGSGPKPSSAKVDDTTTGTTTTSKPASKTHRPHGRHLKGPGSRDTGVPEKTPQSLEGYLKKKGIEIEILSNTTIATFPMSSAIPIYNFVIRSDGSGNIAWDRSASTL
jgi:hypothetical protein